MKLIKKIYSILGVISGLSLLLHITSVPLEYVKPEILGPFTIADKVGNFMLYGLSLFLAVLAIYLTIGYLKVLLFSSLPTKRQLLIGATTLLFLILLPLALLTNQLMTLEWGDPLLFYVIIFYGLTLTFHFYLLRKGAFQGAVVVNP
ncbi:MAG: hypothetical protein ACSHX8_13555 [Opitutaceae bacterium]